MVAFPRHRKWGKKRGQMQEGAMVMWVGCSTGLQMRGELAPKFWGSWFESLVGGALFLFP